MDRRGEGLTHQQQQSTSTLASCSTDSHTVQLAPRALSKAIQPPPPSLPSEMMRFVAVVAVAFLLCAGGGAAAQKVDISSKLSGLDVPEGLYGSCVTYVFEQYYDEIAVIEQWYG